MRVLYSFPHTLGRAGIAETALQQILGLDRLGVVIVLFCGSLGGLTLPPTIEVHETMVIAGRRVPHRAIGVQRAYSYHDWLTARWLAANHAGIDVVHAWPRGCLHTLNIARRVGVPSLRESPNPHTASVMRASAASAAAAGVALPADHSHASNRAVLAMEEQEYAIATAVLVPSDYALGEFVAEGFAESHLLQHRYGVDIRRFPERRATRMPTDRPFRAIFVGRGDPTKGLHVALAAWRIASLSNAELLIAGRIQPDYARGLLGDLSLPGVRALGFVTDVTSLFAEADVLVLPSWTEGSALVIMEAEASGCVPLVSTASGPIGIDGLDFLEHPVGDAAQLARQLTELASDPARLAELSRHGTSRRGFLSWDTAAEVLRECYLSVIDGSTQSS